MNSHPRFPKHLFLVIVTLTLLLGTASPRIYQPAAASLSVDRAPDVASSPVMKQSSVRDEVPADQIIIKYKASADLSGVNAPAHPIRMHTLSAAAGVRLEYFREMSGDAHVLRLQDPLPVPQVQLIADRLMTVADVDYAEPDRILQHTLTPNDPLYSNQWHYFETYGINAPAAWDITTGSSSIVVAVIDSGITNHADLGGRAVSGYDFIANVFRANDGDGRDSDPSDPGDWTAVGECGPGSPAEDSSWHGTHVAGTIGAASNNGMGVAGVNWNSRILPVRVLGKCGGPLSDIVDGMRWAAGLAVTGVPANANPAKVLNLSLGGPGSCSSTEQNAINAITTAGAVVVVAAGNDNANASGFSPGNCNGVITVAATDRGGQRAFYSNFGSVVEISAPGGEASPTASNGVLSTLNTGLQGPVADMYEFYQGTSMAAPHVAGVASLLYSLSPSLTPGQVGRILTATVTAFPSGSTCNTSICGTGVANGGQAVAELLRIDSLSPNLVESGSGSFTLVVDGANFADGAVVKWNGASRTTGFVSSAQLTATIPASDIALPGVYSVTVTSNHAAYGSITTAAKQVIALNIVSTDYLPLIVKNYSAPAAPGTWTTIVSENFEGSFPGAWIVDDNDGAANEEYYWAKRNCRADTGSYSGWAVGGGTNGAALACDSHYPNNAESWMVYGPFSLAGASAAELNFRLWLNSELDYDGVCWMASVNGTNFYGTCTTGNTGGWVDQTLDLSNVYTLGNLLGQPNVWVALIFASDGSDTFSEGGYVDNIVLRKCTGETCTGLNVSAPTSESGRVVEFQASRTRPR